MVGGLRTGDLVRADAALPPSKHAGVYVGRLAVRATGWCTITTGAGTMEGIQVRHARPLQRADGYAYARGCASAHADAHGRHERGSAASCPRLTPWVCAAHSQ